MTKTIAKNTSSFVLNRVLRIGDDPIIIQITTIERAHKDYRIPLAQMVPYGVDGHIPIMRIKDRISLPDKDLLNAWKGKINDNSNN